MAPILRRFHDLGQHAGHVLRVHEEHRRSVRTDADRAEDALAGCGKLLMCRVNVGHLERQVMLPAERIALQECCNRRALGKRRQQLNLRPDVRRIGTKWAWTYVINLPQSNPYPLIVEMPLSLVLVENSLLDFS